MKILVSGSSGLIGAALVPFLESSGHEVIRLVRSPSIPSEHALFWNPKSGMEPGVLEGFDAIVNLAGENISKGRWTAAKKSAILHSRIDATRLLCESLAKLQSPPKILANASAIGFYGNQGSAILDEDSPKGQGFLADVCQEWEASTEPARKAGVRVIWLRFGVVLSEKGGAFGQMLTPFKIGVGGVIGSGKQYMSWISIDDLVGAVLHIINTEELAGAVNLVAPNPVTNDEFTKTLGRLLKRPTIFPLPAAIARLLFGEMADELLLSSTRVLPGKLNGTGYRFLYPQLELALRHLLKIE